MLTTSDFNLNLQYTPNSIPQPVISLKFCFNYKYDRAVRDILGREIVIDSYPMPDSRLFHYTTDNRSLLRPSLFCRRLHKIFTGILNLDEAVRFQLARTIVGSVLGESYRQPLSEVVANVQVVETEFINDMETPVMVDGEYILDEVGGGESRSEAVKKLIKRGEFKYRSEGGEEECPICLENYGEGIKVVKIQTMPSYVS